MASIIPGYEYDIFISYRQKDNKGDRWVSEFVDALKDELESTFKDEISVYFDINSHDGLLETHDVGASLKEKVKCLVFIPIISQTYCDPKSFAWQYEFCIFNKIAKEDQFGRDIRLGSGNIASRILPIRIHDLDSEDKSTLENELGGVLRALEFIYKEPGVNRPLKPTDNKNENLNKTDYKNQINKVANAIKEIITSLRNPDLQTSRSEKFDQPVPGKKVKRKILAAIISSLLLLLIAGYLFYPKLLPSVKKDPAHEKSIAVIPFVDMSPGKDQEYFSDGMMEEILNHLFKIGGISIPSMTTMMSYKGTTKSAGEVGRELKVANILEGSIRKTGSIVRITVKLIDPVNDELLWVEIYDRDLTDILSVQSEVAQKIAGFLKAEISPKVKQRMEIQITQNIEALDLYLKAKSLFGSDLNECEKLLKRVILLDPNCSPAYAALGGVWLERGIWDGTLPAKEVVDHATPLLNKALELNYYEPSTHKNLAWLALLYNWDFKSAINEFNIVSQLNPSDITSFPVNVRMMLGDFKEALLISTAGNLADHNFFSDIGLSHYFLNENEKALEFCKLALKSNREDIFTTGKLCIFLHLYDDAIKISEEWLNKRKSSRTPVVLAILAIADYHTQNENKTSLLLDELKIQSYHTPIGSPAYFIAMIYAEMQKPDLTFEWLEKAYRNHEIEMIWLRVEPAFRPWHQDPRWQQMIARVGFPE